VVGLVVLCVLVMTPFDPEKSQWHRLGLLSAYALLQGIGIGPLLEAISVMNGGVGMITTAFCSTTIIFVSFTLVALFSKRRSWLYLFGPLLSGLNLLLFISFMNFFVASTLVFSVEIYFGLILFTGFVIFDTQLIVEKAESGNKDFVLHSLNLFLDFLNIFIRILIIIAKLKGKNSEGSRGGGSYSFDIEKGQPFNTEL